MSGALQALAGRGGGSRHTVTIGGTDPYGYNVAGTGALSPLTYRDHGGNSRTIEVIVYNDGTGNIIFRLDGSITNNDTAFTAIKLGGTVLARSTASYSNPSGDSQWAWGVANVLGTSGTKVLVVL